MEEKVKQKEVGRNSDFVVWGIIADPGKKQSSYQ